MMANGKLVRVLLHTGVVKYLEFKAVDGSYVLSKGKVGSSDSSRGPLWVQLVGDGLCLA
jgi:RAB protein geranylgeranyltransferase component A